MTWESAVKFIRGATSLPVWLKGSKYIPEAECPYTSQYSALTPLFIVYTPEDVKLAIKHGFDGVVISNHGGRQLDSVPASLDNLRRCAPIAKGVIPIAIDSGIRRGTDIFKAIALGADCCFAGRIPIWGHAVSRSFFRLS